MAKSDSVFEGQYLKGGFTGLIFLRKEGLTEGSRLLSSTAWGVVMNKFCVLQYPDHN
jgi:hypothetical protein